MVGPDIVDQTTAVAAREEATINIAVGAGSAGGVSAPGLPAGPVKGTGIRANSVLPSIIDTEPNRKAMPKADFSKWPKPEEIAKVILFLCSDDAKLINGAAVPVYGQA